MGELLVWYLWLALPFVEQLQAMRRHQPAPAGLGTLEVVDTAAAGDSTPRVSAGDGVESRPALPMDPARQRSTAARLWGPNTNNGREWSSPWLSQVLKRETQMGLKGQALNLMAY